MRSLTWAFIQGHDLGRLKSRWWRLSINPWHTLFSFLALWGVANFGCFISIQVTQRAEPQQEFRAEHGEIQGSWGAWGPWSTCSRTCGRGVQEQSRPCLPVYTPSQYPSRRAGVHPQQPGHVISALRPTVPLHRNAGRSSNISSRGDQKEEKETRPSGRRYCIILHRVMRLILCYKTNWGVEINVLKTGICKWKAVILYLFKGSV